MWCLRCRRQLAPIGTDYPHEVWTFCPTCTTSNAKRRRQAYDLTILAGYNGYEGGSSDQVGVLTYWLWGWPTGGDRA